MKTKHMSRVGKKSQGIPTVGVLQIYEGTIPDDTELKNLLKAIYDSGFYGEKRSLSDDLAAVRRLV